MTWDPILGNLHLMILPSRPGVGVFFWANMGFHTYLIQRKIRVWLPAQAANPRVSLWKLPKHGYASLKKNTENEQMWWILILPLHATSCHFKWRMPLRVAYATSSGVCHFEWRMPLRVAYALSSGVCHFEWRMPLRVACWLCSLRVPSGVCHLKCKLCSTK